MNFLYSFVFLFAFIIATEAFRYQISLSTFNVGQKRIRGQLSGIVKGENLKAKITFPEVSFHEYRTCTTTFDFPETVKEIEINFTSEFDKNSKFILGTMIIADLKNSEVAVFQPKTQYISTNENVFFYEN